MAYDVADDIRLDPRIKAILAGIPVESGGYVDSRETLLAEANSDAARQQAEVFRSFMDLCDTEDAAPSAGLRVYDEKVVSEPDGNSINLRVTRRSGAVPPGHGHNARHRNLHHRLPRDKPRHRPRPRCVLQGLNCGAPPACRSRNRRTRT